MGNKFFLNRFYKGLAGRVLTNDLTQVIYRLRCINFKVHFIHLTLVSLVGRKGMVQDFWGSSSFTRRKMPGQSRRLNRAFSSAKTATVKTPILMAATHQVR